MSRDRVYTRRELESLRRADLQTLYRIHGIKGSNQRSAVLVDGLVEHYSSPAFAAAATTTHPRHANRLRSIETQVPHRPPSAARSAGDGSKTARAASATGAARRKSLSRKDSEVEKDSAESALVSEPARPTSSASAAPAPTSSRSFSQPAAPIGLPAQVKTLWKRLEALESRSTPSQSDIEDIRSELRSIQEPLGTSSRVTLEQVEEMLRDRDRVWEERIQLLEAKWEQRFQAVINGLPASVPAAVSPQAPHVTVTEDTPTALASKTNLGKRRSNPPSSPQTAVDSQSTAEADGGSPRKKARLQKGAAPAGQRGTFRMPKTPEARVAAPEPPFTPVQSVSEPRTPSPSHQGTPPDNSKTPSAFGPDFFADLPRTIATPDKRRSSAELPYPVFATTPKPHEPRSPTLDAPPSASRNRANYGNISMLTPGRVQRAGSAPRAVSQAHMDLSTITEATEEPLLASVARQRTISAEPNPADLLGPSLARDRDATLTPPRLSPSPSIADSHFSQVALPHASGRKVSLQARATGGTSPRIRAGSSPAREYMEVALRGLNNPNESPSALATPGHRTMLGTERYRDTRFGDVPMPAPAWPSPRVDLMSTPGAASARLGE